MVAHLWHKRGHGQRGQCRSAWSKDKLALGEGARHLPDPRPAVRPARTFVRALRSDEAPHFARTPAAQAVWCLALTLFLAAWLAAVGRPPICPCGTVSLWAGDVRSPQTSQQFADWYSLLHVVFGFTLFLFLDWMKPAWSTGQKLVLAVASSLVWEVVENLPPVIALFGHAPGAPPYAGDSVLNAVADTLFVGLGFLIASRLPVVLVLALAVGLELMVLGVAGDGYILGSLRLLGMPF